MAKGKRWYQWDLLALRMPLIYHFANTMGMQKQAEKNPLRKKPIALYAPLKYLLQQSWIWFQCNMNRPIYLQKLPSSHQPCLLFYVFLHHLQSLLWSTFLLDVRFPFRLLKGKLFGLRICLFSSSAGPKYLFLIQTSTAQCFRLFSTGCLPFRKNLFETISDLFIR